MRLFMILAGLLLAACSTTVTGPVTGKQYNLDVGCTDDMKRYWQEREAVMGETAETTPAEVKIDCPVTPEQQH